jgi:hypothetical protein
MNVALEKLDDRVVTPWLQPVNRWQGAANSIHTDSVAQKIGMRGGTIPGTVHLAHFGPMMTELFGDRWLKTGSIGMFYTYATVDREDVRAFIKAPPTSKTEDVLLDAWVETKEGRVVCKGSVSVGKPQDVSYVRSQPLENAAPGTTRILRGLEPGADVTPIDNFVITEGGKDGVLRDAQELYHAMMILPPGIKTAPAVGFFGATEITLHNGPVKTNVPYRKTGKYICIGESPKTEYAWYDSALHDKDGQLIAEMRHMTRWMKASSPLWNS